MKTNNKGMSYVELLLVLAIMAILIGVVSISVGLIGRTNVTRGAEKLSSTINQSRSTSMARGSNKGQIEISYSNGRYYYYVGDSAAADKEEQKVEFLASPGVLTYGPASNPGAAVTVDDNGEILVIRFNQASGSIKEFMDQEGNMYTGTIDVTLTNGDKSTTVRVYQATGKCELIY